MIGTDEGRRAPFGSGPIVREYRPGDGDALRELWRRVARS